MFWRILRPIDTAVLRLTRRRSSASAIFAGLPVVLVTTTGARTGRHRTIPLFGVPFRGNIAIAGTNWGGPTTLGWVHNLESRAEAAVAYRDRRVPVIARPATTEEEEAIASAASAIYPGSAKRMHRARPRIVRVFVLEERSNAAAGG